MLGELMRVGRSGLGDGGGLPNDDYSYTGESGAMDYFRNKAREFQSLMNGLDTAYRAAWDALSSGISDDSIAAELSELIDEFESKRAAMKLTAEGINAGAALINAAGGRFPQLSIPSTLGVLPAIPVGMIAAIAGIATLAVWGNSWIAILGDVIRRWQLLGSMGEAERARAAAAQMQVDGAKAQADGSIWSVAGGAIKWIAIGALGFFAWQAFQSSQYSRRR